jgi:hypothetical protein
MTIVNTRLLSHPMNYLTVGLMWFLAGLAGHYLLTLAGLEASSGGSSDTKRSAWESMPAGQAPGEIRANAIAPQMAPIAINSMQ